MNTSVCASSRVTPLVAIAVVMCAASVPVPSAAAIVPRLGAAHGSIVLVQGVCRVGEYASHDHAISVRNTLQSRGYQAWIENHGSLYSGTRTYVVFVRC